jgi:hypothetical protein
MSGDVVEWRKAIFSMFTMMMARVDDIERRFGVSSKINNLDFVVGSRTCAEREETVDTNKNN